MQSDKIIMAAGVTVASVVGAYVFWGPSGSRSRQRCGLIAGLNNFGQTCFLNTLLQAMAACPEFIAWLELYVSETTDRECLFCAMLNTLQIVNGTHSTQRDDPYSPGAIIRALNALGWLIPQEEQDAHELFHVLIASLEEEAMGPPPLGCLSDALSLAGTKLAAAEAPATPGQQSVVVEDIRSSGGGFVSFGNMTAAGGTAIATDGQGIGDQLQQLAGTAYADAANDGFNENEKLVTNTPAATIFEHYDAEKHLIDGLTPPTTVVTVKTQADADAAAQTAVVVGGTVLEPKATVAAAAAVVEEYNSTVAVPQLSKHSSTACHSLTRLKRGPCHFSVWSNTLSSQVAHPFQGAMGNQIVCNGCGCRSAVRFDKFDSVTLNLPPNRRSGLSLGQLLSEHVRSENLSDVMCDMCNETTTHTKLLTFAKLPTCLCIHIARTVWLPTGQICKRQDYVHFPECLSMAPYSFVQPHLPSPTGTHAAASGSSMSLLSAMNLLPHDGDKPSTSRRPSIVEKISGAMFPKNLYRLMAVVVHSGEADSGHFVTYRRGVLRNTHRWFYTSDTFVREVTIEQVLSAPAYLLFYDRGAQRLMR